MNLSELRTFLAIVETGSLVRASEMLNVTQSTVTARLQSLESTLGQRLINRNKSGASMTAAGVRLRRYADTINDLWQQARQETSLPEGLSGVCNIACEADLWPHLGQDFFAHLYRHHPTVAVSVWQGSQTDVSGWLNAGKSDLAFTYRAATTERQGQIELPPERLILVTTEPSRPVRFHTNYVFVEAGDAFGRDHAAAYADTSTARISFGTAHLGLEHLLATGGSAYLPARLANPYLETGVMFRVDDAPEFQRPVFLTFNKSAHATWGWFNAALTALGQT